MTYTYKYPRPALTVDIILFNITQSGTTILLIQRKHSPFENKWAFPGGFVDMDETLENAALRELEEETGVTLNSLQQFYVFDALDRDPRHRTISVIFYAIISDITQIPKASDDASNAVFFNINNLPDLAFDHNMIIQKAIQKLL